MDYFIWAMVAALLSVAASTIVQQQLNQRPLLDSGPRLPPLRTPPRKLVQPLRRDYLERDTARAFYSYGYSDDTAAKAEYIGRDGTSRGFYSYVDANGKLQTVKYEAGRKQGFKAEATNLPKAPVDDRKAPEPVQETLEVQQAREAQLNALREAEALEASLREEAERDARVNVNGNTNLKNARQPQPTSFEEESLSEEDEQILVRVRAELTAMLADQLARNEQRPLEDDQAIGSEDIDAKIEEDQKTEVDADAEADIAAARQRLTLISAGNDVDLPGSLRTVYTLADISSSSYLKLGDLAAGQILEVAPKTQRTDDRRLRVPVSAVYTLLTPTTKYSVSTPTELRTLRLNLGSTGNSLPIALSRSLLKQRLNNGEQKN
ncbi:uncharacterized protein LOC115632634 [Scaptodrosophila lebanonensis]|uniref:Uncharacterized protein LOC115632634 n=1 Tax=Drosophila lebanonensis TaxID=7225 RepID=A0A6J2UE73_DROLE|nr:uncharacterized protein LOC115632634 [Scaptodrosophila lebanonensis]